MKQIKYDIYIGYNPKEWNFRLTAVRVCEALIKEKCKNQSVSYSVNEVDSHYIDEKGEAHMQKSCHIAILGVADESTIKELIEQACQMLGDDEVLVTKTPVEIAICSLDGEWKE